MNRKGSRSATYVGIQQIGIYRFKIYNIGDEDQHISSEVVEYLCNSIDLDPDYTSENTGFAIVNFGRRGVSGMLFHVGRWVDTLEIFSAACYRFHEESELLLQDKSDTLCSVYELELISFEFSHLRQAISSNLNFDADKYLKSIYRVC